MLGKCNWTHLQTINFIWKALCLILRLPKANEFTFHTSAILHHPPPSSTLLHPPPRGPSQRMRNLESNLNENILRPLAIGMQIYSNCRVWLGRCDAVCQPLRSLSQHAKRSAKALLRFLQKPIKLTSEYAAKWHPK